MTRAGRSGGQLQPLCDRVTLVAPHRQSTSQSASQLRGQGQLQGLMHRQGLDFSLTTRLLTLAPQEGEELLFAYGPPCGPPGEEGAQGGASSRCLCGTPACLGWMPWGGA